MKYKLGKQQPQISDGCFIAPSADVIGDVQMAENASVWFNCVLRADNEAISIGKNSNIQDGSVLHVDPGYPLTIGADVTIGHKVMLHGCTIGDGSLVGMNAVVLNGAKIGKNCLIGANALITENMEVADGQMAIGSPAKIVKSLDQATQQMLSANARHYVDNGQRYQRELEPLD